ncbi:MAG: hypothetical protein HY402_00405 [Elusimicrobia bacterium]|nr:hypothetical protein [Elusimicrobiota bacterium]
MAFILVCLFLGITREGFSQSGGDFRLDESAQNQLEQTLSEFQEKTAQWQDPALPPAPRGEGYIFRAYVDLVQVPVTLMKVGKNGSIDGFITDLDPSDLKLSVRELFKLREQEHQLRLHRDVPIQIGFVIDARCQMFRDAELGKLLGYWKKFLEEIRPEDRYFVVAFDNDFHRIKGIDEKKNPASVKKEIEELNQNKGDSCLENSYGPYEAIQDAIREMPQLGEISKNVLVVLTSGGPLDDHQHWSWESSRDPYSASLKEAIKKNIQVIFLIPEAFSSGFEDADFFSTKTGGVSLYVYLPHRILRGFAWLSSKLHVYDFQGVFKTLYRQLKDQYVLVFYPSREMGSEGFVEVRLEPAPGSRLERSAERNYIRWLYKRFFYVPGRTE